MIMRYPNDRVGTSMIITCVTEVLFVCATCFAIGTVAGQAFAWCSTIAASVFSVALSIFQLRLWLAEALFSMCVLITSTLVRDPGVSDVRQICAAIAIATIVWAIVHRRSYLYVRRVLEHPCKAVCHYNRDAMRSAVILTIGCLLALMMYALVLFGLLQLEVIDEDEALTLVYLGGVVALAVLLPAYTAAGCALRAIGRLGPGGH